MNCQQYSDNTQQYLICFYEILNQMIADMTNASLSCSLSSDFINQMIPHHRAAIHMSRNLLMYTTNIPLQNIAQNIIKEQTQYQKYARYSKLLFITTQFSRPD